jgi:hypothetical protein
MAGFAEERRVLGRIKNLGMVPGFVSKIFNAPLPVVSQEVPS